MINRELLWIAFIVLEWQVRYLRDQDGREVDFVVLKERKPLFAVEVKLADTTLSPAITYFCKRVSIPRFYQVVLGGTTRYGNAQEGGEVIPFIEWCKVLGLV